MMHPKNSNESDNELDPAIEKSLSLSEVGIEGICPGNQILIRAARIPRYTKGQIWLPDSSRAEAQLHTQIGKVLRVGELCYKSGAFEGTVWCKEGDWILFSTYESMRINMKDNVCYFINDCRVSWNIDPKSPILEGLE
jgi:co-chaperonin GroES (HSP10)